MANTTAAAWRDSARTPRFFVIDALSALPLLVFLIHIRTWTFVLAIMTMVFFGILERFNFTVPVFFRWLRSSLAGPVKVAKPEWRK